MADFKKAMEYIGLAQVELAEIVNGKTQEVANCKATIDAQSRYISDLERQIQELRNTEIRAQISSGESTRNVAERYGISSARVSQIAPKRSR